MRRLLLLPLLAVAGCAGPVATEEQLYAEASAAGYGDVITYERGELMGAQYLDIEIEPEEATADELVALLHFGRNQAEESGVKTDVVARTRMHFTDVSAQGSTPDMQIRAAEDLAVDEILHVYLGSEYNMSARVGFRECPDAECVSYHVERYLDEIVALDAETLAIAFGDMELITSGTRAHILSVLDTVAAAPALPTKLIDATPSLIALPAEVGRAEAIAFACQHFDRLELNHSNNRDETLNCDPSPQ